MFFPHKLYEKLQFKLCFFPKLISAPLPWQVDMHSSNMFVAGLSLTTVGNLATPDIARDLMMEVEKHLRGGRPYLVKKVRLHGL